MLHIDQNITASIKASNFIKKQYYLAVTNLSALLEGKSSNHHGNFYCLNCFNSYTTENNLKEHEEICNNHDGYHIEMSKQAEKY